MPTTDTRDKVEKHYRQVNIGGGGAGWAWLIFLFVVVVAVVSCIARAL